MYLTGNLIKAKKQPKTSQILTSTSYLFYVNLPQASNKKESLAKLLIFLNQLQILN